LGAPSAAAPAPARPPEDRPDAAPGAVEAVVIGVSTGGPNALAELFRDLPGDLPVPLLIVQHMPPMFTRLLAERLTANSKVPVLEAGAGAVVRPGRALVAPGDFHMVVARDGLQVRAALSQGPPENSCRPAADPLFRSAAKVYGERLLAVVLTGMGQDGLRGCEAVREAGGRVIVQDEATSVVWGMPGFVARAGLADKVLPLPQIAAEIVRRARPGGARA
ncbi:MAG: CheB methylesterase domain-containing protein, partial [Gemmata sp.]